MSAPTLAPERFRLTLVREAAPQPYGTQVKADADAAALATSLLRDEAQEVTLALHLDRKHRLRGYQEIGRGNISSAPLDMRVIFAGAILSGAASLILAHNHPSGDPEPSADDYAVTRRARECAELLGVDLLDHLIIGGEGYVSLRERGW